MFLMEVDSTGLQVLSRAECLALLRDSLVGRVVVTDRALPAAFPVNFALLGEDVVFRTTAGSKLEFVRFRSELVSGRRLLQPAPVFA